MISAALERQRLGLSPSEYNALTPAEIACELEAYKIIAEEKKSILRALDAHLARVELLLNGYKFPDAKSVEDFCFFSKVGAEEKSARAQTRNTIKNLKMSAALRKLQNKIKAKRDEIRAKRKS